MSQPAETWCKVSFVDLVVPLLVRALVIQAKKSKSTKATTVSFNEVVGFLCFFWGKLGVKEENKNWFTSLNMTMPPKERPFQKDISSYSHYFSGDMLVFWRVDEALKHVFFWGQQTCADHRVECRDISNPMAAMAFQSMQYTLPESNSEFTREFFWFEDETSLWGPSRCSGANCERFREGIDSYIELNIYSWKMNFHLKHPLPIFRGFFELQNSTFWSKRPGFGPGGPTKSGSDYHHLRGGKTM